MDAILPGGQPGILQQFVQLCKPRVVLLIVFTAVIGMLLAVPGPVPLTVLVGGMLGIFLVASAAAAINCLVESTVDALMARTRHRGTAQGTISTAQVLALAGLTLAGGMALLYITTNALTMWLTLGTFVGYAIIYTVLLKPMTPQNIVIGGASGAMPPVLGWAAVTGHVTGDALLLFLIIFAWTPPHFWALALYRKKEYAKAGIPMLPITHGDAYCRYHVFLYTLILVAITLLPVASGLGQLIYLVGAVVLGGVFIGYAWKVWRHYTDDLAKKTFRWSIWYLSLLFAVMLLDHYVPVTL
jgi:protoheme IX farnesyltransferase